MLKIKLVAVLGSIIIALPCLSGLVIAILLADQVLSGPFEFLAYCGLALAAASIMARLSDSLIWSKVRAIQAARSGG